MNIIIDRKVEKIIKSHQTNDPHKITSNMKVEVIYEELGDIWGYFHFYKRIPIIHINHRLNEENTRHTIAHELGHYIFHPNISTPFLKSNTLFSIDRIEREANYFAVHLLVGNNRPEPFETREQFLLRCQIPTKFHSFY
ncbi:ImmA/IrrE family metallo-endopeptidase [Paenibacillus sp. 2KB_20]|uniref:ImmA/IrrE family metallo-endopeptidase n=1 Tax=Paenibacillus sp. 2KB_20 TaxID=3232977 RepID=UPI003F961920